MNYGPDIERLTATNPPTPIQLGELATKLLEFAERHDGLLVSKDRHGAARHIVKVMREFELPEVATDSPYMRLTEKTTAARIAHRAERQRSMQIFDSLHTIEAGSQMRSVQSIYEFSWTDDAVSEARKRLVARPSQPRREMIDVVDTMSFRDDDAVTLRLYHDMELLTATDTALLDETIDSLIARIDRGDRPYEEARYGYIKYLTRW